MCGIAGILNFYGPGHQAEADLHRMLGYLQNRGPDSQGIWLDGASEIALGHRRLSINDLSPCGLQPMVSSSGRYILSFNGEIYNFNELRKRLEAECQMQWRGHSDTEVMLAAIESWGLDYALSAFIGMFAFALWDKCQQVLYLARDRIGEKPLYYGWMGHTLLFGSELKALRAHPCFEANIDQRSVAAFLRHGYIPAPYSIYQDIQKVLPGTYQIFSSQSIGCSQVKHYWSLKQTAEQSISEPFTGSEDQALRKLEALLTQSVTQQMIADVPLGAFLSGGIDSSIVVALMQAHSQRPIKTFTIGFHEAQYNEADHAQAVATYLGTDHTSHYVSAEDALNVIPKLPSLYDEPFSDMSQIPTFLVSHLARQQVTVSLSGDGGDELFGGYERYIRGLDLWRRLAAIPRLPRRWASGLINRVPNATWDTLQRLMYPVLPAMLKTPAIGDKAYKFARLLSIENPEAIYLNLVSHWKDPDALMFGVREHRTVLTDPAIAPSGKLGFLHQMMYLDSMTYLPDDILVKVDRASMGVSLESRIPFLDPRIIEFAWQLPVNMKIRNGTGKWLLRKLLYQYVPQHLVDRPKAGFGVPMDTWLRGPLREWAEHLLGPQRLREEGYFNAELVRQKWHQHLAGSNQQFLLWDVLMFQAWLESQ